MLSEEKGKIAAYPSPFPQRYQKFINKLIKNDGIYNNNIKEEPVAPAVVSALIQSWDAFQKTVNESTAVANSIDTMATEISVVAKGLQCRVDKLPKIWGDFQMPMTVTMRAIMDELERLMKLIHSMESTIRAPFLGEGKVNQIFMSHLESTVKMLGSMSSLTTTIRVSASGESSISQRKFGNAILDHGCFPESGDENTACPVCIVVDDSVSEPRLVLPSKLKQALNRHHDNIFQRVAYLHKVQFPPDITLGPLIEERMSGARALFESIINAVKSSDESSPARFLFGDGDVVGSEAIRSCLENVDNIIRLIYCLRNYPRYSMSGLPLDNPLAILVNATANDGVLDRLPTIYSPCNCASRVPYLGQLKLVFIPRNSKMNMEPLILDFNNIFEIVRNECENDLVLPASAPGTSGEVSLLLTSANFGNALGVYMVPLFMSTMSEFSRSWMKNWWLFDACVKKLSRPIVS